MAIKQEQEIYDSDITPELLEMQTENKPRNRLILEQALNGLEQAQEQSQAQQ